MLAVGPAVGLHLATTDDVAHLERPRAVHDLVGDRRPLHRTPLADELREVRERPAELAR